MSLVNSGPNGLPHIPNTPLSEIIQDSSVAAVTNPGSVITFVGAVLRYTGRAITYTAGVETYKINESGLYSVSLQLQYGDANNYSQITKNGLSPGTVTGANMLVYIDMPTASKVYSMSRTVSLNAGDYVQFVGNGTTPSNCIASIVQLVSYER